jgi:hypothetical protein
VVKAPEVLSPTVEPIEEKVVTEPKLEIAGISEEPESPIQNEIISPVVEEIESEVEELEAETMDEILEEIEEEEIEQVQEITMLTPIKKLEAAEEAKTAVLKPVTVNVLNPVKRRGPPPSSAPGQKPGELEEKEDTATLKPVTKLTPVESPNTTLNIESEEDEA